MPLPGEGCDPQITVAITGPDDRAFLTRRDGPAVPDLRPEDLVTRNIRHVHIGELATLAERPDLLDMARDAGASISLDCSWDESLGPSVAPLVAAVDVFLPNDDEARRLRSLGVTDPFAPVTVTKKGSHGGTVEAGGQHCADAAVKVPSSIRQGRGMRSTLVSSPPGLTVVT